MATSSIDIDDKKQEADGEKKGIQVKERKFLCFFFSPNNQKYSQAVNSILILNQINSKEEKENQETKLKKKKHRGSGFSSFLSIRILLAREASVRLSERSLGSATVCALSSRRKIYVYIYLMSLNHNIYIYNNNNQFLSKYRAWQRILSLLFLCTIIISRELHRFFSFFFFCVCFVYVLTSLLLTILLKFFSLVA